MACANMVGPCPQRGCHLHCTAAVAADVVQVEVESDKGGIALQRSPECVAPLITNVVVIQADVGALRQRPLDAGIGEGRAANIANLVPV